MERERETVAMRVSGLRERRGWSLAQLGDRSGVHYSTIWKIERGKTPNPGHETLRKIGDALGVRLEDLTGETTPMPTAQTFQGVTYVPVVRRVAHATAAPAWVDTHETTPVSNSKVRPGMRPLAAPVTGECLAPEIEPGDTVVWDSANRQPQDGQVVVVSYQGDLLVKRAYHDGSGLVLVDNLGNELRPNGAQLEGVVITIQKEPRRRPRRA